MKRRIPRSVAKHIRREKARIRKQVLDPAEQKRLISELLKSIKNKK
jgi:hypothetical protein